VGEDELDELETELELRLLAEYKDVVRMFRYVVETERRFYLTNAVHVAVLNPASSLVEVTLTDAWVWDMYRPVRFVTSVRVLTNRDVNIETLPESDFSQ
jgi:hypothetical protein